MDHSDWIAGSAVNVWYSLKFAKLRTYIRSTVFVSVRSLWILSVFYFAFQMQPTTLKSGIDSFPVFKSRVRTPGASRSALIHQEMAGLDVLLADHLTNLNLIRSNSFTDSSAKS